ncbi:MAG: ATP cone domain-containing protein, partial [Steroidobacteraceae bacterium]
MTLEIAQTPTNAPETGHRAAPPAIAQPEFRLTPPAAARTQMGVTKRNGTREPVDVSKIVRAVTRCCEGLSTVDPMRVA